MPPVRLRCEKQPQLRLAKPPMVISAARRPWMRQPSAQSTFSARPRLLFSFAAHQRLLVPSTDPSDSQGYTYGRGKRGTEELLPEGQVDPIPDAELARELFGCSLGAGFTYGVPYPEKRSKSTSLGLMFARLLQQVQHQCELIPSKSPHHESAYLRFQEGS